MHLKTNPIRSHAMKISFAFALLLLAPVAQADPLEACKLDATTFHPKFKAALVSFLNENLPFAWNPASLTISCQSGFGDNNAVCPVTFKAKDGTPFLVHDDVQFTCEGHEHPRCDSSGSSDGISVFALGSQATDAEGNYTGPITCSITDLAVVIDNQKTNNQIQLKTTDGLADLSWTLKAK